jgi:hypothetical protein
MFASNGRFLKFASRSNGSDEQKAKPEALHLQALNRAFWSSHLYLMNVKYY